MRTGRLVAGAAVLALAASACSGAVGTEDGRPSVVVGFYPLQYLAERIGGELVRVQSLAQPGAEPHDLELRPQQVEQIAQADVVFHLAGLQPAVDDAVAQNAARAAYDGLAALDATGDPHVWLDPSLYAELATGLAARLDDVDPEHAATYAANAATLAAELEALDEEYADGLAECARREFVTTHDAFGRLATRYDLEQVAIAGISPEDEPSPQDLAEVRDYAQRHGVTTIFYEEAVSPEYAETVAAELGADTAVLSPVEVVDAGEDYPAVMRANLAALQEALDCP